MLQPGSNFVDREILVGHFNHQLDHFPCRSCDLNFISPKKGISDPKGGAFVTVDEGMVFNY